jgi:ubiquinone/menaquinone biosynthesis C-methylase UbiE
MAGQNDTRQTVADCCGTRRCGLGDYSLHAAQLVGNAGLVIAMDRDALMIREVENKVLDQGFMNIQTLVQNIMEPLSLGDSSADICLESTSSYFHRHKTNCRKQNGGKGF